jgi:TatA/E family protein of Tat protein translocase
MFGLSFGEIALIVVVALLFLGPKKLPELAKGMGEGIRDFQKALKGDEEAPKNVDNDNSSKPS